MEKVVTPEMMAEMDRRTISGGISGIELMEKAGLACAEIIGAGLSILDRVLVICGSGNNGGDGYVIARILAEEGHPVRVLCTGNPDHFSEESKRNYDRLGELEMPVEAEMITEKDEQGLQEILNWPCVIVDCIFGNGLSSRPLNENYHDLIYRINGAGKNITAIDIPSGLRGDNGKTVGIAVKASRTIAIQCIKTGCLINDGPDYCGEIQTVDIGIEGESKWQLMTYEDLILPVIRRKNSHKYQYGAVSAIVGSKGMYGAAQLASEAALISGCGLVTAYVPETGFEIFSSRISPEIMVQDYNEDFRTSAYGSFKHDVTLFGCGIGRDRNCDDILDILLNEEKPVIIDAGGIWHLSQNPEMLKNHLGPLILTPHWGEFAILSGLTSEEISEDPVSVALNFSQAYNVILVLKGYRTMTVLPDGRIWFNSTGNPGMATAGSGDVLAGMIAGMIAQGGKIEDAVRHAVYYHGDAGDTYAGRFNETTLRAGDLLSFLKVVMESRSAE